MKATRKIVNATIFKQFAQYKKGANIFGILLLTTLIISTIVLYIIESGDGQDITFTDFLWTTLFTIVGVADFAEKRPVSNVGKLIIFVLSVAGIGIVGWIIAELAGNFVLTKLKEVLGMSKSNFENHIVVCGWNSHASTIVEELCESKEPFVLLANLDENPLSKYDGMNLFVKGDISNTDDLKRAGIEKARTAIILADTREGRPVNDVDAQTILTSLAIESIKGGIHTIAEILNPKNKVHAANARIDEIILYEDFVSKLIVTSVRIKGMSKIFEDIMSFNDTDSDGFEFYATNAPLALYNKTFDDAIKYYRAKGALPIAICRNDKPMINPTYNELISEGDQIIFLAKEKI